MLRSRSSVMWLVLVFATFGAWGLGEDHGVGALIVLAVFGIAALKVRIVGLEFMEVRRAPLPLRLAFEVYCVAVWCVLAGFYAWT